MTLTAETAPTPPAPAPIATVIELPADQIAQHPDNLRDATRGIRELAASIAEVGVLVPLIVVPVAARLRPRIRPRHHPRGRGRQPTTARGPAGRATGAVHRPPRPR